MSRKILLVGDLHFRSKRLDDIAPAWASLVKWASENKVDLIAQAGDVFDHSNVYGREASTGTIYNAFLAPFKENENPPKLVCVPGNHDMGGPRDKDALAPVDKYDWITVCRKITTLNFFDDLSISFLPWVNRANLISMMMFKGDTLEVASRKVNETIRNFAPFLAKSIEQSKNTNRLCVVLGHLEVTGCILDSGLPQVNGNYEFSPADLASMGADVYAIGHIHKRQNFAGLPNENDGYLGAFCHLRFSDKDNPTGCRLIEYEGRKIISDRFLENKKSPRYYLVKSLENKTWNDNDYVKYRGTEKPEKLPPNVVFEREKTEAEFRIRMEDKADADTPIDTLLKSWAEICECKIDLKKLIDKALTLGKNAKLPTDPIGSLERIDRIQIERVMSHLNTLLDFSNVNGVCAIEGHNGSGKTSAMESFLFGLYGEYPTRPKLEMITKTGENHSAVEVDFQSYNKKYKVRREVKKTAKGCSQKALLFEEGVKDAVAGPKVDDVLNLTSRIVGDREMVLSGVFSAQNEAGNIIDLRPSDRKSIFAKLLGTDKFIALSGEARNSATALEATVQANALTKERLLNDCMEENAILAQKKELEGKLSELEGQIVSCTTEIEGLEKDLKNLELKEAERSELSKRKDEIARKMAKIKEEGVSLKAQRKALDTLDEEKIKDRKKKLDQCRKMLPDLQSQLHEVKNDIQGIESFKKELIQEAAKIKLSASEQFSSHLLSLRKERDKKQSGILDEKDELNSALKAEMVNLTVLKGAVDQAKKQSALVEGIPNQDVCKQCPLAKEGINAKTVLPIAEEKLKKGKEKVTEIDNQISDLNKKIDAIKLEQDPVIASYAPAQKLLAEAKAKEDQANGLSTDDLDKKKADLAEKVNTVETFINANESVDREFESLSKSGETKAAMDAKIDSLKTTYLELDSEVKAMVVPDSLSESIISSKATITQAKNNLNKIVTQRSFYNVEIGRIEEKINGIEKKKAEIKKIEDQSKTQTEEYDIYTTLAKAFGKDGIPQLIVEQMLPHFESIMKMLLEEFDDQWSIQVVSQKMNKTNTNVQERIDIIVDDGEGERDISTFSGGERRLLKAIVRIAFAIVQAERSGKGLKVLIMDEATDSMDENYAEGFVSMLTKLKNFNQLFIISHNHRILSHIPVRFTLTREPTGSKVQFCST